MSVLVQPITRTLCCASCLFLLAPILFATTILGFSHKYTVTGFKVSDEFLIFIHSFVICVAGKGK